MTREEWKERLPLIQAYADGKDVQIHMGQHGWRSWHIISFSKPVNKYRIAPEPKLRPWTAEEVPVGAVIRYKRNTQSIRLLIVCNSENGMAGVGTLFKYPFLMDEMEYSLDGFSNWLPCGVVEGEK